jgi:excisionase family DNA binding protein
MTGHEAPKPTLERRRPRWLTTDQAAHYLGFPSRKALYQAVRRGQVPGHRIGRRLRFDAAELDLWINRSRTHLAA